MHDSADDDAGVFGAEFKRVLLSSLELRAILIILYTAASTREFEHGRAVAQLRVRFKLFSVPPADVPEICEFLIRQLALPTSQLECELIAWSEVNKDNNNL